MSRNSKSDCTPEITGGPSLDLGDTNFSVHRTDGRGEVELETYALLQRDEAMAEACVRRIMRGIYTRDYELLVDLAAAGFGM